MKWRQSFQEALAWGLWCELLEMLTVETASAAGALLEHLGDAGDSGSAYAMQQLVVALPTRIEADLALERLDVES
jgi:hypothetical protein